MLTVALLSVVLGGQYWSCEGDTYRWAHYKLEAPCVLAQEQDPKRRLKKLMKAWSLSESQASCALAGISERGTLQTCVTQWPEVETLWVAMLLRGAPREGLDAVLAKVPSTELAEKLLELREAGGPLSVLLVRKDPSRLGKALVDPRLDDDAKFELSWTVLREKLPVSDDDWPALTEAVLDLPLTRDHWMLAAELWLSIPAAHRALPETPKARVELVLGLIALGRKIEAGAIKLLPFEGDERESLVPLYLDAARWHLTGKRELSLWNAAVMLKENGPWHWDPWVALLPYLSPRESDFVDHLDVIERSMNTDGHSRSDPTAVELRSSWKASEQRARELVRRLVPAAKTTATQATLPEAMPSPFVERSKPWTGAAPQRLDLKKLGLRDWYPIRAEKQGKRRVALAYSQRLDPVGEVSPGSLWLLISEDGGAWKEFYLCLGDHRPFHALEDAKVPLLDANDVVRISVADAPIDDESIVFPPIATQAPTKRALVVLEASLESLRRDTDRDGLSDLVEARLLLDPHTPDTDGDGVTDGNDPTPRLDDRLATTPNAEFYNAFFENFGSGRKQPPALIVAPETKNPMGELRVANLDDVRFLQLPVGGLTGLRPLTSVITLTAAELELARARFGEFYPMSVDLIVNGTDEAFVTWSEGWRGGTASIKRDPKTHALVVTELTGWIT